MAPALLGKKLGMTQLFDAEGRSSPVTLIEAGPCHVLQVRTLETDGYQAMQLGFDPLKKARITKPQAAHAAKTNGKPMYFVREFRLASGETVEPGSTLTVGSFEGVKLVDVVGTTKGKGFQGVMKRWHFGGQCASHGTERKHRSPGAIASNALPDKGILPGKKMSGHMGHVRRTAERLTLIKIDAVRNLLIVKGSIPGPNGGYVMIRKSVKE
jgi:large subunit ribosomal protein L3